MKKSLILVAVLALVSCSNAQKQEKDGISQSAKDAFTAKFQNAEHAKWQKEDADFEVEFEEGETEFSALYTNDGKLLELEQEIKVGELPAGVVEYVTINYPKAKNSEAAKITDNARVITYEAEIKGKDLIFSQNGEFIKVITD